MTPKSPFEINWPLKVSKSTWYPLIVAVKIQNFNFAKWQPVTSGITPGSYNYFSTPMGSTFEFSTTKPVSSLNQVGSKAPFFSDMIKNVSAPTIIGVNYLPWNSICKNMKYVYISIVEKAEGIRILEEFQPGIEIPMGKTDGLSYLCLTLTSLWGKRFKLHN